MKTQATKEAVKDLIHSTHRTSEWTLKILQAMKIGMPILDEDKEDEAIDLILKVLAEKGSYLAEDGAIEAETIAIQDCINELDYYADKGKVVDAAIAELQDIERKIKRLKTLQPVVKRIFQNLDIRTKAIFTICDELMRADGVTFTDYSGKLDVFRSETIDILRNDPDLAPAIEAYDLAREVNEMLQ